MIIPPALDAAIQRVLDTLFEEIKGISAVIVSTSDGRDLAMRGASSLSASKLGAMSSSMSALASAIAEESRAGEVQSIIVEAADGYLLVVAIPHVRHPLTLSVQASRAAVLGQITFATRRSSAYLAGVG